MNLYYYPTLFDFLWFMKITFYTKVKEMMERSIFMMSLLFSITASAWDCPLCRQHFESDGSLPHNCQSDYTRLDTINNLLSQSGFTLEPSSPVNAKAVFSEYLGYLPLYDHKPSLSWGVTQWLYHWFEHLGLCEHGGSVGGSWLTLQGGICHQHIRTDQGAGAASTTQVGKLLRSFKKRCLRSMGSCCYCNSHENMETLPSASKSDFSDWYYGNAGMCGCGNPNEVYKLLYDSIVFFEKYSKTKKPYDKFPIEHVQLRNCFISWLIYQGLLSPQLAITEGGHQILLHLRPGYPEYDQDPCDPSTDDYYD